MRKSPNLDLLVMDEATANSSAMEEKRRKMKSLMDERKKNTESSRFPMSPRALDNWNVDTRNVKDPIRHNSYKNSGVGGNMYKSGEHMSTRSGSGSELETMTSAEDNMKVLGVTPIFDPSLEKTTLSEQLDFSDMRTFLTTSLKRGTTLQCTIIRNKTGIKNKLYPSYELYIGESERFLLAAKKRSGNKSSNYLISMDKTDMTKTSPGYLGKVRSNFVGTTYTIYDRGNNPKDSYDVYTTNTSHIRQELGTVFYDANVLGTNGPRRMTVCTPAEHSNWRPIHTEHALAEAYKSGQHDNMNVFSNKKPQWDEQLEAYVLDFNNRVTKASVKNFQLVDASDADEKVALQFGRIGADKFIVDFGGPFSPLQAFSIALTSLDGKFACE